MTLFNERNKEAVDAWLSDPTFRGIVEKDLGAPISVKVDWNKSHIEFTGPNGGKRLQIQDILDAITVRH